MRSALELRIACHGLGAGTTERLALLPQCFRGHGQYLLGQGLADKGIRDVLAGKRMAIVVQRRIRLLQQELSVQAAHRRSRLQSQLAQQEPCEQMARWPRRRAEQGRKNRQESTAGEDIHHSLVAGAVL